MIRLSVPSGQDGARLTDCLLDMLPELKMGELKKLLRKGDVRLNGVRARKDGPVAYGDTLELFLADEYDRFCPELQVVYEDENLMVVNKQPGISCISDRDDGKPTLYLLAVQHMKKTGEYCVESLTVPYLCHRLDHYTGGLVIIAKTQNAYDLLTEAIRQRRIRKYYQCIVVGHPRSPEAELHDFLEKDAKAALVTIRRRQIPGSLPIVTRYRTLAQSRALSLLEVELVTGRTHQIRAHLAFRGTPVLGDDKYGDRRTNKVYGLRHQALWAVRLIFETGVNNPLEYLNNMVVETDDIRLPHIEGLDLPL